MTYHLNPEDAQSSIQSALGPIITMERKEGETVWSMVEEYSIPVDTAPTICVVNGEPRLRAEWHKTLDQKDVVIFVAIPKGSIFKDLLRLLAVLALAVVAPWAAGIIGGIVGITSAVGLSLIQAGIVVAGSFLINALLPPTAPKKNDNTPSPTYSVQAQGNTARLYQPIPKMYGKHIIYPDYATDPYYTFSDNKQTVYMLFVQGLGKYVTHQIRIDQTLLWDETTGLNDSFAVTQIEFYEPGEPVTLFHTRVQTSQEVGGIDLNHWYGTYAGEPTADFGFKPDGRILTPKSEVFMYAQVGQKITVVSGVNAGTYTILSVGNDSKWIEVNHVFIDTIYATRIELHIDSQWGIAYEACTSNTVTNKLEFDFFMPRGSFWANDEGGLDAAAVSLEIQAMLIDTAGQPLGPWITIGKPTYTKATSTPQRFTESYDIEDGRYKVRVRRTSPVYNNSRSTTDIQWGGLRAYIPHDNTYDNVSLIAVKMVATGQLSSQSSKQFNFIQTAILPVYSGSWSEQPTRSIAWAAYDIINNGLYGAGWPADTIDLEQLVYLDGVWTSRGDYFDAVFDQQISCWDALVSVLRAGRTIPILIGGTLTFRRREDALVPKGIFTPNNIVRGSFNSEHILFTDDSPDDIIIEFMDNRTWKINEVRCTLPGSLSVMPERQQLFGVTGRLQAWREGIFAAAFNAKNRIVSKFDTELDGRLLVRGDIIYVAHDMYNWGQHGEVLYYIPSERKLVLDRDVKVTNDSHIILRKRNGSGWGPVKIFAGEEDSIVIFDYADLLLVEGSQGDVSTVWALDTDQIPTKFIIAEQNVNYKRFSVVSGSPKGDNVELVLLSDDPTVHTADQGTPPSETYPYEPGPARPVIPTLNAVKQPASSNAAPIIDFTWGAATPDATDGYVLQISYDNQDWVTIYSGSLLTTSYTVYPGMLFVRVRGIRGVPGPWKVFSASFGTPTLTPLPPLTVTVESGLNAGTMVISWSRSIRADYYNLELWVEGVIGSGTFDTKVLDVDEKMQSYVLTETKAKSLGGPWPNVEARVKGINTHGSSIEAVDQLTGITLEGITGLRFNTIYTGLDASIEWNAHPVATSYVILLYPNGSYPVSITTIGTEAPNYYIPGSFLQLLGLTLPVIDMKIGVFPVRGKVTGPISTIDGHASTSRSLEDGTTLRVTESGEIRVTE